MDSDTGFSVQHGIPNTIASQILTERTSIEFFFYLGNRTECRWTYPVILDFPCAHLLHPPHVVSDAERSSVAQTAPAQSQRVQPLEAWNVELTREATPRVTPTMNATTALKVQRSPVDTRLLGRLETLALQGPAPSFPCVHGSSASETQRDVRWRYTRRLAGLPLDMSYWRFVRATLSTWAWSSVLWWKT